MAAKFSETTGAPARESSGEMKLDIPQSDITCARQIPCQLNDRLNSEATTQALASPSQTLDKSPVLHRRKQHEKPSRLTMQTPHQLEKRRNLPLPAVPTSADSSSIS